jgi:O-antigen/teichoic acid export membrane protein
MAPDVRASLAGLLGWYLAGTAPYIAGMVYVRALSAEGRSGVLTSVAAFGVMFFGLMTAPLVAWIGLDGVGLATSTVSFANAMLLAGLYHRGGHAKRGVTS